MVDYVAEREKVLKVLKDRQGKKNKKEALKHLQDAGILDKNGNVTEPYKDVFVKKV
jgi:hypothetical protein